MLALDPSQGIGDMDVPGFRFHPLKGAAKVCLGKWQLAASILDYEGYH
jgi:hypothetical protein